MSTKRLTFVLMDASLESDRLVTAFRIFHVTVDRGYDVHVFAYDRAPFGTRSRPGWVESLAELSSKRGGTFEWVECGFYEDERGADFGNGVRPGTPADFARVLAESDNVLVIPARPA